MKTRAILAAFLVSVALPVGADEAPDKIMGNWEGRWNINDNSGEITAKIVARGSGKYDGYFTVEGKDGEKKTHKLEMVREGSGEPALFSGQHEKVKWDFSIRGGKLAGNVRGGEANGTIDMERVLKSPPTMGAKPPKGAVVLFDGTTLDGWTLADGTPAPWKVLDSGAMQVSAKKSDDGKARHGNIVSKEKFTDHKIHLEFRTPFMPTKTGQARGNSGVYVQGRYEVQVLDSFGLPPRDNEAGGIYQVSVPLLNASLPPGEWQTYDITFHAPKYEDGNVVEEGEITVVYNGETIHDKVKLSKPTPGGTGTDPATPGGLLLQDHGNPVQYRNIWVLPID